MIDKLKRVLINIPGWRTNRKIIVIESDDWGSIRMPSKEVFSKLLNAGIRVDKCPYNTYDSLESEYDLIALFETLTSIKDKNGNHPVITANTIVANPDFSKIKESNFQKYYYEIFTETLKKYPKHSRSFELWKEGISHKIFFPQFHGREHLNVGRWMNALKDQLPETRFAFDNNLFGISDIVKSEKRKNYLAALDYDTEEQKAEILKIIQDGLILFEKIFGYKSKSFIAPSYTWFDDLERIISKYDVKYLQGITYQKVSGYSESKKAKKKYHFIGQKNKHNQIYLVRNVFFEPTIFGRERVIDDCMMRIRLAFSFKKPVIIGTHRLNFIGFINEKNRDVNLKLFRELLTKIKNEYPQVEFLNSSELGKIIDNEN